MGHSFLRFTAKEYKERHQRSSMAIIPGLEKYNLLLLLQTFQLWISTSTALNTSPLWRCCTRNSLLIREVPDQGRNHLFISGGAIFMKFHSMMPSYLSNRGTTFSQTVTYNKNAFLPADTKSIVQTHTFCTTLVNKNRTFYNSVGGWITSVIIIIRGAGVKRNFWLHAICACTEQHSTHKIRWENWRLGLRVWCLGNCVGLGFMLQLGKEK